MKEKNLKQVITYYVQPGRKGKLFTLWRFITSPGFFGVESYICNLSKIGAEANKKALAYVIESHKLNANDFIRNEKVYEDDQRVIILDLEDENMKLKDNHRMPERPVKCINSYLGYCITHYKEKYNPLIDFGKYKGKKLFEIRDIDLGYYEWLCHKAEVAFNKFKQGVV